MQRRATELTMNFVTPDAFSTEETSWNRNPALFAYPTFRDFIITQREFLSFSLRYLYRSQPAPTPSSLVALQATRIEVPSLSADLIAAKSVRTAPFNVGARTVAVNSATAP
jgi:hypothetical protein